MTRLRDTIIPAILGAQPRVVEGPRGPQGFDGIKGDLGAIGPEGPQGEMGPRGFPGPTGDQGPKGDPGQDGHDGPPGPKGPKGDRGPKGDKGDPGPEGPEGPQGRPGQTGYRGGTTRGLASGMVVKDEGSVLNNGALVGSLNFTGAGVAASMVGDVATVNVAGGGGGGGSTALALRIIGPFALAFDTANIHDEFGVLWQAMPVGSFVFMAGARTTTNWSASVDQAIYLGPSDGVYAVALYCNTNVAAEGTTEGPAVRWSSVSGSGPVSGWVYPAGGELRIRMDDVGATTGAADIYAIIATVS